MFYTTGEVSEIFGVSSKTLYKWIKNGVITSPIKEGTRYIWSSEDLDNINNYACKDSNYPEDKAQAYRELEINNRRYLGCKKKLLRFIDDVVRNNTTNVDVVADLFAGTGVVSDMFAKQNKSVIVNDLLTSNYVSYVAWFSNLKIDKKKISIIIDQLNRLDGVDGYVTKNFGNKYFTKSNAMKIDAIREKIELLSCVNFREKCILLTSLMYALDSVANTVGHYDAYRDVLDQNKKIKLHKLHLNEYKSVETFQQDANILAKKIHADLVYLDPPYNSRGYENTYHLIENIVEWKKPPVEGKAMKALNRSLKSSEYTKKKAPAVFDELIRSISARYILVSYNNMENRGNSRSNAKISKDEIILSLSKRGEVKVFDTDFNIFSSGKTEIENNKELLYLCKVNSYEHY